MLVDDLLVFLQSAGADAAVGRFAAELRRSHDAIVAEEGLPAALGGAMAAKVAEADAWVNGGDDSDDAGSGEDASISSSSSSEEDEGAEAKVEEKKKGGRSPARQEEAKEEPLVAVLTSTDELD